MTDKPKLTLVNTIPTAEREEVRAVVDVLERALAEAKEGKIVAIAISVVASGSKFGFYSSCSPRNRATLSASVNLTNWRLCQDLWDAPSVETEEYDDPPPEVG
jgi:hypothetical protein